MSELDLLRAERDAAKAEVEAAKADCQYHSHEMVNERGNPIEHGLKRDEAERRMSKAQGVLLDVERRMRQLAAEQAREKALALRKQTDEKKAEQVAEHTRGYEPSR